MFPTVFITRRIHPAGMDLLAGSCTVIVHEGSGPPAREEMIRNLREAEGMLCMLTDPVDSELIDAAPRLKVISNYAVGYNNIDVRAAGMRGIVVTNTPGVLTETTAETAFALMIACARRIVESDRWLRRHTFTGWEPMMFLGQDLHRKTLGIIGMGRIGRALARRAANGFDMRVLYADTVEHPSLEGESGARAVTLEHLLRESDFVSIHTPLTPETRHLIGAPQLGMMKPTACLINTARGPVVDEQALISALRDGTIFSAGLDVYEEEPLIPSALLALENVVLLPHIGSASVDTRRRMAILAAENLLAVLQGREPAGRVPNEAAGFMPSKTIGDQ